MSSDYERRLSQQVEQYKNVANIHDLPSIFHHWSNRFVRPVMEQVFEGRFMFPDVYAHFLGKSFRETGNRLAASLGAGDGGMEIETAKSLIRDGTTDFVILCVELSEHLIIRGEEAARAAGVHKHIRFLKTDINHWRPEVKMAACMANQSLHHFENLEHVFDFVAANLESQGSFITNDMIGRNGHMRWPEARSIVDAVWSSLPQRYRYNQGLSRLESPTFLDWDCSVQGFEGVRAQDIMPLLVKRFGFTHFAAWGGFIDVFVDRNFGHNFNEQDPAHRNFIDQLGQANDALVRAGVIKPTQIFAVMSLSRDKECRSYAGITPEYAIRWPNAGPEAIG